MADDLSFLRKRDKSQDQEESDADGALASLFSIPNVTRSPTMAAATLASPSAITVTAGVTTPRGYPPGWTPATFSPLTQTPTPTTVTITMFDLPNCTGVIHKNVMPITADACESATTSFMSHSTATITSTMSRFGEPWTLPGNDGSAVGSPEWPLYCI